ncbi:hypothetical protein HZS_2781 [Henneguya salminicola]|nr:hypothetical protein HZS_2781 [Henneguya salminicola]
MGIVYFILLNSHMCNRRAHTNCRIVCTAVRYVEYCDNQRKAKKCYNGANDILTCENKNITCYSDICNSHGVCVHIRSLKTKFIANAILAMVENIVKNMRVNSTAVGMENVKDQTYALAMLFIAEKYVTNTYVIDKQNLIVNMTISAITQIIQQFAAVKAKNFERIYARKINARYSVSLVFAFMILKKNETIALAIHFFLINLAIK